MSGNKRLEKNIENTWLIIGKSISGLVNTEVVRAIASYGCAWEIEKLQRRSKFLESNGSSFASAIVTFKCYSTYVFRIVIIPLA